jgi:hypothetical protein
VQGYREEERKDRKREEREKERGRENFGLLAVEEYA